MSIIVLTSAGGAPGTTTTALGLTLAWPRPVILVDADREPTQAVLAGYLGGADPLRRGLSTYALEARESGTAPHVEPHCLALNGNRHKLFMAGFANPGAAALFDPWWGTLLDGAVETDRDVLIDAGRIGMGLPAGLVAGADEIVVVGRSSLRSVAAQRLYLPALTDQLEFGHAQLELLLVGQDQPYAADEVAAVLGMDCGGVIAWDPQRAAVLSDGEPGDRRFARSSLAGSYLKAAELFVARQSLVRRRVEAAR